MSRKFFYEYGGAINSPHKKKSRPLRVNGLRVDLERRMSREQKEFQSGQLNPPVCVNPKEPYLYVKLVPRTCTGLVDSGSGVTLIKESVFQALEEGI